MSVYTDLSRDLTVAVAEMVVEYNGLDPEAKGRLAGSTAVIMLSVIVQQLNIIIQQNDKEVKEYGENQTGAG